MRCPAQLVEVITDLPPAYSPSLVGSSCPLPPPPHQLVLSLKNGMLKNVPVWYFVSLR
jgi:hypothetical protein